MGALDFTLVFAAWPKLLAGLGYDFYFATFGFICGCAIGFVCYLASASPWRAVRWLAYVYVQIVRGMPMYLLLLWLYFGLASKFGLALSGQQAIITAIAIMSSAFCAEVFRSGYGALDLGQAEAGKALGMTGFAINRHILLPQVIRTTIPPLLNIFVICFKAATYAAVVAVPELVFQAQDLAQPYRPPRRHHRRGHADRHCRYLNCDCGRQPAWRYELDRHPNRIALHPAMAGLRYTFSFRSSLLGDDHRLMSRHGAANPPYRQSFRARAGLRSLTLCLHLAVSLRFPLTGWIWTPSAAIISLTSEQRLCREIYRGAGFQSTRASSGIHRYGQLQDHHVIIRRSIACGDVATAQPVIVILDFRRWHYWRQDILCEANAQAAITYKSSVSDCGRLDFHHHQLSSRLSLPEQQSPSRWRRTVPGDTHCIAAILP